MNQNQKKICQKIYENENITIQKLANNIGISPRSVERNIKKLREEEILKRVGGRKEGHWELQLD